MHKSRGQREIQIPLIDGTDQAKVQAFSKHRIGILGGVYEIPMPAHSLSTSNAELVVGLPEALIPVVLFGGDRTTWLVSWHDGLGVLLAVLAALIIFRTRKIRALATVVFSGMWILSLTLFIVVMMGILLGLVLWWLSRLLRKKTLVSSVIGLLVILAVSVLCVVFFLFAIPPRPNSLSLDMLTEENRFMRYEVAPEVDEGEARLHRIVELSRGGVLEGVRPVALPLPRSDRFVRASQELVTERQPFAPVLVYLNRLALIPLYLVWLGCLVALVMSFRRKAKELLGGFTSWLRERAGEVRDHERRSQEKKETAPTTDDVGTIEEVEIEVE